MNKYSAVLGPQHVEAVWLALLWGKREHDYKGMVTFI